MYTHMETHLTAQKKEDFQLVASYQGLELKIIIVMKVTGKALVEEIGILTTTLSYYLHHYITKGHVEHLNIASTRSPLL